MHNIRDRWIAVPVDNDGSGGLYNVYGGLGILPESYQWTEWLKRCIQQDKDYGRKPLSYIFEEVCSRIANISQMNTKPWQISGAEGAVVLNFD